MRFHFIQTEAMSNIGMSAVVITLIHPLAIEGGDAFMVNNEVAATHCNPLVIVAVIAFAYLRKALFLAGVKASSLSSCWVA